MMRHWARGTQAKWKSYQIYSLDKAADGEKCATERGGGGKS